MAQLPTQSQFGDYGEWPGRDVLDSAGERLGAVREIYLDRETGRPEWVLVDVDGGQARFVPLADAAVESSTIRVAHAADRIRSAPSVGTEPRIDQSEERRLYAHYGLGYSEAESDSGLPTEPPEPTTEAPAERAAPAPPPPPAPPAPPEAPAALEPPAAPAESAPLEAAPEPTAPESPAEPAPFTPPPPGVGAEPLSPSATGPTVDQEPQARAYAPPPPPEEPGGGGKRKPAAALAGALAGAALLFFIVRKLR